MTLEGFVIGVAIAIIQNRGLLQPSRHVGLFLLIGGLGTLLTWLASADFMAVIDLGDVVQQPAIIAILAGVMTAGAVQLADTPMPLTKLFRGLSRLSYSLYLVHYPLIPLVITIAAGRGLFIFWMYYFVVSLTAAFLLYLLIERPFLKLKDRLAVQRPVAAVPV
jgi:peptidoglycan/LPS O-acetylase OafA/YrhL